MTVHQIDYRCWALDDPANEEYQPHYRDVASAGDALAEIKADTPDSQASIRQEDAPCWVADCDGPGCEERYEDEESGGSHFGSAAELDEWMAPDGWTTKAPDQAFCWADSPEDATPPPPSPAEQETAGQLSFLA